MAITDMNSIAAGIIGPSTLYSKDAITCEAAGISHTPWYNGGITGAGVAPTGGLNGATFAGPTLVGQIAMPAAVAGKTTSLARWSAVQAGNVGALWLIDRLWGNVPVVTTTGAQAITSPAWPARDQTASTNGAGVFLALEVSATTGNVGAITNTTVSYTNSAGTAGRTANLVSAPATALTGTWLMFSLSAGDQGIRSVQSITLGTSYVSGAIHLAAFRFIADLPVPLLNTGYATAFPGNGNPTIWDASVLQLVYWPTATALGALAGSLTYCQI